ncbi:MAG: hypothetical protein V4681_00515 [Patescibacteria group bacterium]
MSDSTQEDKSKYIRTYAKDVAALSGEQGAKIAEPRPEPAPIAPPPAPVLRMPQASKEVAETYRAPVVAPTDTDREELFARLKKKVSESAQIEIASAPPPPPLASPEPIAPPQPLFEPVAQPAPAPMPAVARAEEKPSPIHTYKSDFADHIDARGASSFSVLAAQQDAKRTVLPSAPKKRSVIFAVSGILLIVLGGVGVATAAWYVMRLNTLPPSGLVVPSLVFADEQVKLQGSGNDLIQQIADLANEPLPEGNVIITYLSESTTTSKGEVREVPLSGGTLIAAMKLPAPDILLRNIAPFSTVGILAAGGETRPFFIFRVTSYERTFAGMLAWEVSMDRDLAVLYPARGAGNLLPATQAPIGTSTPQAVEPVRANTQFEDAIVQSHDVRVLRDTAGNTLMLYGYVDKETLVLARDEAAYTQLLSRLAASRTR